MLRSILFFLLLCVSAPSMAAAVITISINPASTMTAPANPTINVRVGAQGEYGINSVTVFENNVQIHQTGEVDFSVSRTALAVGTWTYRVEAIDQLNVKTTKTATLTVTASAKPVVTLTGPTGSLTEPATALLKVTATDSDGTVARVDISKGGQVLRSFTAPPYEHTVTGLAAGTHSFTATAYDNTGVSGSATLILTVNAKPAVSIVSPTSGQVLQSGGNVVFSALATDPEDAYAKRVEFFVDGEEVGEDTYPTPDYSTTPHKWYFNHYMPVATGTHTLVVKAYDAAGAVATSAPLTFHVNTPPTISLTAPAAQARYVTPASIAVAATASDADGIASVKFYVDGTLVNTDTTSPYSYTWSSSTVGNRSIEAVVTDTRGGVASDVVNVSVVAPAQASTTLVSRQYVYDDNQQLCKVIEPETGATATEYDAAGNIIWTASGLDLADPDDCSKDEGYASGRRVDRTYDARNRIRTVSFPDGRGNLAYTYEPGGKVKTIVAHNDGVNANTVTTDYTYNRRGLLTRELLSHGAVAWAIDYAYTSNAHLASQAWHGLTVDYAPNALGQATKAGTYASGVTYHPNGGIKQFTYGNGIVHTLTQNTRGLPDRSLDEYGGVKVLDDSYDYDGNGNVAAITDGATGTNQRGNRTMTYDGLDRLTRAQSLMFGTTAAGAAAYSYDVLDNLTRVTINSTATVPGRDWKYFYDTGNRLTNVLKYADNSTVMGLDYDVQGNVKQKSISAGTNFLFDFDYGNRLRATNKNTASGPVSLAAYLYDGHGRRWRDFNFGVDGATAGSKYSQYSLDGQLLQTSDARTGTFSEYIYLGGSLVAIRERTGVSGSYVYTTKYQHTDALGSPVAVTDANRVVLERNEYEPFGKVLAPLPAQDGPGFTGHVLDALSGMNYMQQRYYDPMIGRFLSVDPIAADHSQGGNFNRYWYANNNPFRFVDPDGRATASFECTEACKASMRRAIAAQNALENGDQKTAAQALGDDGGRAARAAKFQRDLRNRLSGSANGAMALGVGVEGEYTHELGHSPDKVGFYPVLGIGGFIGGQGKVKVVSWGGQGSGSGLTMKGNPLGYFKLKVGLGLAVGLTIKFNDRGGGHLSLTLGGGFGGSAIVKPPMVSGWEKEL